MLDLLFLVTTLVFFAVSALYVFGCDFLIKDEKAERVERIETAGERTANQN
jgi:hypothetical protein